MFKINRQHPVSLDLQFMSGEFYEDLLNLFMASIRSFFKSTCKYGVCASGIYRRSSSDIANFDYLLIEINPSESCSVNTILDIMSASRGQELELQMRLNPTTNYNLFLEIYSGSVHWDEFLFLNPKHKLMCFSSVSVNFEMMETCPMVELSKDTLTQRKVHSQAIEAIYNNSIPVASFDDNTNEQNDTFKVCFSHYMSVIQSNNVSSSRDCVYVALCLFVASSLVLR